MQILALDSSGMVASAAVLEREETDSRLLASYSVDYKKTHSQTLLPMIDEMAKMIELDPATLDAIAVAAGPGSFTGLRIGAATAKGLGLALKIPLIGIPTLEGMAYNLWGTDSIVCPILDARRDQVYTGIYEFQDGKLVVLEDQMAIGIEELGEKLRNYDREVIFLGDGVPVFGKRLREDILPGGQIFFAPENVNRQRAASVGALAFVYYEEGKAVSAADFVPEYLRPSQAERVRAEKQENRS